MSDSPTAGTGLGLLAREDPDEGSPGRARALARARAKGRDPGYLLRRMLIAGDGIAILLSLAVAMIFVAPSSTLSTFGLGALTIPGWWLIFKLYGLYDRDGKRVSHSTLDDVPRVFHAIVVGSLGVWLFIRWADPEAKLILAEGFAFVATAFVTVLALRVLVRALPFAGPERVLLVGGGPLSALVLVKIGAHPELRLKPVGYLRGSSGLPEGVRFLRCLGDLDRLAEACRETACDRVLIVNSETDRERLAELVHLVRKRRLRVSLVPAVHDTIGPSVEIDDIEGVTILGVAPPVLSRSSRVLKRGIDLTAAAFVLALSAPLLAFVAVAIRLSSPGPVIFAQDRIGRSGRRFRLYKFRTMVEGAPGESERLMEQSEHSSWLLLNQDLRVTPIGRLLRRTCIDELPQLWNVLRGQMSLVGPRPMTPEIHEHISGRHLDRVDLTPGMTGLWQVLGRTAIPFEEMLKLDYLYVTNWSLWQDMRLLLRTVPAVIRGRGAN